jgi:hypothetical protein
VIAYKFLRSDGTGVFTRFPWAPDGDAQGAWVEAPVDPCRSGIHACRTADLPYWVGRSLFEVELDGEIVEQPTKVVAGRARLLRRVTTWDDRLRDAYTRMCADRAHEIARATPRLDEWDAVVEPSLPEGPALLGFAAARIAEERWGAAAYRAERERQSGWLVERLGL